MKKNSLLLGAAKKPHASGCCKALQGNRLQAGRETVGAARGAALYLSAADSSSRNSLAVAAGISTPESCPAPPQRHSRPRIPRPKTTIGDSRRIARTKAASSGKHRTLSSVWNLRRSSAYLARQQVRLVDTDDSDTHQQSHVSSIYIHSCHWLRTKRRGGTPVGQGSHLSHGRTDTSAHLKS
jgi:hypothetical protein